MALADLVSVVIFSGLVIVEAKLFTMSATVGFVALGILDGLAVFESP